MGKHISFPKVEHLRSFLSFTLLIPTLTYIIIFNSERSTIHKTGHGNAPSHEHHPLVTMRDGGIAIIPYKKTYSEALLYRLPASNQSTISAVEGNWKMVQRHSITANSTPSDATFMPIVANGTSGKVCGFVFSAFAETRERHPRVKILSMLHNKSQARLTYFYSKLKSRRGGES